MGDPLIKDFLSYLKDKRDLRDIDTFRMGLIWEKSKWTDTVLENLDDEVNNVRALKRIINLEFDMIYDVMAETDPLTLMK